MSQPAQPQAGCKLSIVVPCYNTERYLPTCMDSLVAQDMDGIEVIGVDDGSPDGCLGILQDYERRYPNLVRVLHRDNGRLWTARWTGIDAARGDYVAFVDSDDCVEPDFARTLYETAVAEDADVVVCGFSRTDLATGRVLSREFCDERAPFTLEADPGRIVEVNPAAWNKAFRRGVLATLPRLSETPPILEDLALTLLAYTRCTRPVAFAPRSLVHYMVHADSMINTVTEDQVEAVLRMMREIRADYVQAGCPPALMAALDAVAFEHLGVSMPFRLSANADVDLKAELAHITRYLDESFPTWRRSPYINGAYARAHGSAFKKLLVAQRFYRAHLMRPFLWAYSFAIRNLHVDIKW